MKTRLNIDWSTREAPSTFMEVTLANPKAVKGPAVIMPHCFALRASPKSKKANAIGWGGLLYCVRQAALRWPAFRAELHAMVDSLPIKPRTDWTMPEPPFEGAVATAYYAGMGEGWYLHWMPGDPNQCCPDDYEIEWPFGQGDRVGPEAMEAAGFQVVS